MDPSVLGAGTDWLGELLGTGVMQNYSVSYSGGNDKSSYYMSAVKKCNNYILLVKELSLPLSCYNVLLIVQ